MPRNTKNLTWIGQVARGACVLAIAFVASADASYAQMAQRYRPSRPTVSPYLNLLRFNAGPLPNYYSLVRPQLYQQEFNQQQVVQQTEQNAALKALQQQRSAVPAAATPTGKGAWFQTYGRATYQNTSGYFSRGGTGAVR